VSVTVLLAVRLEIIKSRRVRERNRRIGEQAAADADAGVEQVRDGSTTA
jgi:hypothetical protein